VFPALAGGAAVAALLFAGTRSYESLYKRAVVRRDATATVTATGRGMNRHLLVNGNGMTGLTPLTKMMAHLPLAFLERPPRRAIVVCFGMGTSHRSVLSWRIESTAVELVPSVPELFGYFHDDAEAVLRSPRSRIVIDDGRRYLERSEGLADVIVIDPPPPVEAAGSSLLYSREFYVAARRRLAADGILQQWIPAGEPLVVSALLKAVREVFPHVRTFESVEGWGLHILARGVPIPEMSGAALAERLPDAAARDLVEWGPLPTAAAQLADVLAREKSADELIARAPEARPLADDHPVNEYFLLRRHLQTPATREARGPQGD
jgi:spermidine synthase